MEKCINSCNRLLAASLRARSRRLWQLRRAPYAWFGPYKLLEWWHASNVLLMWIKIVSWQRMAVKSWKICVGEEQISPVHNFMYARNTSACNGEISRSFLFLSFDLYVTREHKMTTFDSTGCGSLCLKKIWQNRLAPPKHTGVFDDFLRF